MNDYASAAYVRCRRTDAMTDVSVAGRPSRQLVRGDRPVQTNTRRTIWAVYWLVLLTLTHLPPSDSLRIPGVWTGALLHMLLFMLLGLLGAWAMPLRKMAGGCVLGLGLAAYAAMDECTQGWTGRTPDYVDWLADAVGVTLGITLYFCANALATRRGQRFTQP